MIWNRINMRTTNPLCIALAHRVVRCGVSGVIDANPPGHECVILRMRDHARRVLHPLRDLVDEWNCPCVMKWEPEDGADAY